MAQTDFAQFEAKTPGDRSVMHVLYGLHTLAWAGMGTLAVIAVIANYIKRADELDALYVSHHNYMIATFWWTVLWLVLAAPLWIPVLPGWVAYTVIFFWYLYRCLRGWLRFADGRAPS